MANLVIAGDQREAAKGPEFVAAALDRADLATDRAVLGLSIGIPLILFGIATWIDDSGDARKAEPSVPLADMATDTF